jgi:N-acetyl-gamma-glutamyl-phosphate reductase
MNTAIVGASGYGGEILVKLLAAHPKANLVAITSRSEAGKPVSQIMPQLRGSQDGLVFEKSDPEAIANREDIDCVFLAVPHGVAAEYAGPIVRSGKQVIDCSADFRISDPAIYEEYYGQPHPDTVTLSQAEYVLPEIAKDGWKEKPVFACPGCYPTSILVPLYPLISEGIIGTSGIVANSFSGVSGAGKQSKAAFSYCEVNESAKAYGIPKHRHLSEIEEQLGKAGQGEVVLQFNPHLAPMNRGIITTITVPSSGTSIEDLYKVWEIWFGNRPFVHILPADTRPESKYTIDTNRIDISAIKDERTGNFVITSAEDNLMKGLAGQAVQIMNLWQGWDETEGLIHE